MSERARIGAWVGISLAFLVSVPFAFMGLSDLRMTVMTILLGAVYAVIGIIAAEKML